ncbi:GlsB/YeaQ/YmgE family stress response membrane protein [Sphingomonadaceae bacterium LXI357]|uniref:GlsB/YeaQ/YmgE family stress response membrane protein n=2 Tax=Stakelama marina TaxID=2826939 RepID=A0A8T4IHF3_9SPHN|nr:GlsB/YeaQ/YmgE family stress response membrane protein [Stakelama marina]
MQGQLILGWVVLGLLVGLAARFVLPGRTPGGAVVTMLVGIAGALLGGFLAGAAGVRIDNVWERYGLAALGAVVLIALYRIMVARRTR